MAFQRIVLVLAFFAAGWMLVSLGEVIVQGGGIAETLYLGPFATLLLTCAVTFIGGPALAELNRIRRELRRGNKQRADLIDLLRNRAIVLKPEAPPADPSPLQPKTRT